MKLPVSNKSLAYRKSAFILAHLLLIFILLFIYYNDNRILEALAIISIPLVSYLMFNQIKQNIKTLELAQNNLIVSYKKKQIEIPLSQIKEIKGSVDLGFDLDFQTTKTYSILLKNKYPFGEELLLEFVVSGKDIFKEDPISIKILKIELQRLRS